MINARMPTEVCDEKYRSENVDHTGLLKVYLTIIISLSN